MELRQNFYDYVNGCRIEEAKRLLQDAIHRKKTVLNILYEAGFNSKSAFNLAFKKYTGMTPTEFKNRKHFLRANKKQEPAPGHSREPQGPDC